MNRRSAINDGHFIEEPGQDVSGSFDSIMNKIRPDKLISRLAKKTSFVQDKLIPGWADSKIDNLLFAPKNKKKSANQVPKGFIVKTIGTGDGAVHAYSTGSGPTVIFVHGWRGNALQFVPLMRGLARCGFTALAFDHLGHGLSDSMPTTIQQSISTTNDVLHSVRKNASDGLAAIVGHSTGCISIVNSNEALLEGIPLFLISPVFNYKLFFLKQLVKLKLHSDHLKQYAARFGRNYNKEYGRLGLARHLEKYDDVAVIAHDESDRETAVTDSVKFCRRYPLTRLLVTKQFDHNRIINSESVWHELKITVNYDDSTIDFSEVVFQR